MEPIEIIVMIALAVACIVYLWIAIPCILHNRTGKKIHLCVLLFIVGPTIIGILGFLLAVSGMIAVIVIAVVGMIAFIEGS